MVSTRNSMKLNCIEKNVLPTLSLVLPHVEVVAIAPVVVHTVHTGQVDQPVAQAVAITHLEWWRNQKIS